MCSMVGAFRLPRVRRERSRTWDTASLDGCGNGWQPTLIVGVPVMVDDEIDHARAIISG